MRPADVFDRRPYPEADLFGIAIASSSPAVAARCAHARAGAGAVATQNITDPALGPRVLDLLARGASVRAALEAALDSTPFGAYRQLLVVGQDRSAAGAFRRSGTRHRRVGHRSSTPRRLAICWPEAMCPTR